MLIFIIQFDLHQFCLSSQDIAAYSAIKQNLSNKLSVCWWTRMEFGRIEATLPIRMRWECRNFSTIGSSLPMFHEFCVYHLIKLCLHHSSVQFYLSSEISATNNIIDDWIPPPVQPPKNLAIIMWFAEFPYIIANQYITAGIARNAIARLQPMKLVITPNENVPNSAPMQLIDPIQDTCSIVIGPVFSGESSDISNIRAGDTHPTVQPCENMMRLAKIAMIEWFESEMSAWQTHQIPPHNIDCPRFEIRIAFLQVCLPFEEWARNRFIQN